MDVQLLYYSHDAPSTIYVHDQLATIRPGSMIEHFFGSKTRLKLLQIFFREPGKAFYLRELARLTDGQLNGVRREIAHLEEIGVISPADTPADFTDQPGPTERAKYYRVNPSFVLFSEINALLLKMQLMEQQVFIDQLKERAGELHLFVLTGIFTAAADIPTDLLLVGTLRPVTIVKIIKEFEAMLGQPVRYTLMNTKEFTERHEIGDVFLYSILEAKHLVIVDRSRGIS